MKQFVVTTLFIVFTMNVYSQFAKGRIIKGKDTTEVTFILPIYMISQKIEYHRLQKRLRYYNDEIERSVVKPNGVDEIQFSYDGEKIKMLSRIDPVQVPCERCSDKYIFLKLLIVGQLKLFQYYHTNKNFTAANKTHSQKVQKNYYYYYQKGKAKMYSPNNFIFKKEMTKYFSDCQLLAEKIKSKEYGRNDAIKIAQFYNSKCKASILPPTN